MPAQTGAALLVRSMDHDMDDDMDDGMDDGMDDDMDGMDDGMIDDTEDQVIDDTIPSVVTNDETFTNNLLADHWTGYNLAGNALDVMRLTVADNLGGNNANFTTVDGWLADNTEWRYATEDEMQAIADFFRDEPDSFLDFNDGVWSPKADSEEWTALVPTTAQNDGDKNPSIGVTFKPASVGNPGYKKELECRLCEWCRSVGQNSRSQSLTTK